MKVFLIPVFFCFIYIIALSITDNQNYLIIANIWFGCALILAYLEGLNNG